MVRLVTRSFTLYLNIFYNWPAVVPTAFINKNFQIFHQKMNDGLERR